MILPISGDDFLFVPWSSSPPYDRKSAYDLWCSHTCSLVLQSATVRGIHLPMNHDIPTYSLVLKSAIRVREMHLPLTHGILVVLHQSSISRGNTPLTTTYGFLNVSESFSPPLERRVSLPEYWHLSTCSLVFQSATRMKIQICLWLVMLVYFFTWPPVRHKSEKRICLRLMNSVDWLSCPSVRHKCEKTYLPMTHDVQKVVPCPPVSQRVRATYLPMTSISSLVLQSAMRGRKSYLPDSTFHSTFLPVPFTWRSHRKRDN